jgi:hypothetical protein
MTMGTETRRGCRTLSVVAALSFAALAVGCGTYNPSGLSSMAAVDMCELEYMQGRNLSAAAKQTIQSELAKRNDNCRNHAAEVAQRYADYMYHLTYGAPDEP